MERDNQQKLDAFFRVNFQKTLKKELPSDEFTDKVLHKLNKTQLSSYKKNQVVFGRKIKWAFFSFIGVLMVFSVYFSLAVPGDNTYQLPPSIVNLLDHYAGLFSSTNNWLMFVSAVALGFWSLMLLDKVLQRISFG